MSEVPSLAQAYLQRYGSYRQKEWVNIMMKFMQKLGKSLMLPVAVLPIAGILSGIGYWMCPSTM